MIFFLGGVKGVDTCQGDGGAPLVCPVGPANEFRYAQVGSVAWGIGCHDNLPAVYSNVASFRTWIDKTMRGLGYDPSGYTY
jgi:plasma kallikrein